MTAMQRVLALLTAALSLGVGSGVASADEPSALDWLQARLGGGFYAGISFASFNGQDIDDDPNIEHSATASPTFGALISLAISERFEVQSEVALATKGSTFTDQQDIRATTHLYYVEIPVLAKGRYPLKRFSPYGYGGLGLAVLVEGRTEDEFETRIDVGPVTKRTDVGLILGAGVAIGPPKDNQLFFELRYDLGLRNVDDPAMGPDRDAHNSVFSLLGGCAL